MDDLYSNFQKKAPLLITDLFQELKNGEFFVDSDCVFTNNKILVVDRAYDIVDFKDNGNISQYCKFL